jgi:UDP-N-acetylmuramate dehydrogenase
VIQRDVPLQSLNTLATPAVAECFAELEKAADLPLLLEQARQSDWQVRVLGEGSNVVLADRIPGLLIRQACRGKSLVEEDSDSVSLAVAAGENWHEFVDWCLQQGYYGLENLALIPGTVGAAPIQNIGAYGVEVGRFIASVQCRDLHTGEQSILLRGGCEFGYRDSVFKHRLRDRVIIEVVRFRLPRIPAPEYDYPVLNRWLQEHACQNPSPRQVFEAVTAIRSSRLPDPAEIPNAGSFFKNPIVDAAGLETLLAEYPDLPHYGDGPNHKLAAAWLIEQCGFKQRLDGPVRVHPQHALVIINPERRSASDIERFAGDIVEAVAQRFGLRLEQEPRSYG